MANMDDEHGAPGTARPRRTLGRGPAGGPAAPPAPRRPLQEFAHAGDGDEDPDGPEAKTAVAPAPGEPVAGGAPVVDEDGASPAAAGVPGAGGGGAAAVPEEDPVLAPAPLGGAEASAAPGPGAGAGEAVPAARPAGDAAAEGDAESEPAAGGGFQVRLDNFEGPFDLLLNLISKHKLDVTEVALSRVTDEFIAHIRAMGPDWDLDQVTEFLVVASTLLDLKAARLLPAAEVEDEEDLALLEARDLLFARLLQYRAYKRIADIFAERWEAESRRLPRTVGLEPHHAELLPEVVLTIGAENFARLAARAMEPKKKPAVYVDHIHMPKVNVREQGRIVVDRLRGAPAEGLTFAQLTADAPDTLTVVARFLALLDLYREKAVDFDQPEALGGLTVRWTGGDGPEPEVTDEFDRPPGENESTEEDAA